MSVPTRRFERLHLSGGMPPHTRSMSGTSASTQVRDRAIIIRDVFSSFRPDCLPSEYQPDVYEYIINRPNQADTPEVHLRQGNLESTLFRLSAYNLQAFEVLRKLQPFDNLSKHYYEVLQGRFAGLFARYDGDLPPTAATMEPPQELKDIIAEFRRYYEDARQDLSQRHAQAAKDKSDISPTHQRFASLFITQIRRLCDRSTVRLAKGLRSTAGPQSRQQCSYLFQEILGNASDQTGYFGLGVLEACTPHSLGKFQPLQDGLPGLRALQDILEREGASLAYQEKFAALVTKEAEEEA